MHTPQLIDVKCFNLKMLPRLYIFRLENENSIMFFSPFDKLVKKNDLSSNLSVSKVNENLRLNEILQRQQWIRIARAAWLFGLLGRRTVADTQRNLSSAPKRVAQSRQDMLLQKKILNT